jgi:hypothetical protein
MHYRKRNYWPVIYFAGSLSGLVALVLAFLLVKAILDFDRIGDDSFLLFLMLGLGLLLAAGGCIGTFMKKWWGRGILTFFSVLYLLAFPLGTILGIFVLRGLAIHKNEFR